jgi:hypothetical protein
MTNISDLNLADIDGTNGFRINGAGLMDTVSYLLPAAGDVNGDGYDYIIIEAYGVDRTGTDSGTAYVVFGYLKALGASFDL